IGGIIGGFSAPKGHLLKGAPLRPSVSAIQTMEAQGVNLADDSMAIKAELMSPQNTAAPTTAPTGSGQTAGSTIRDGGLSGNLNIKATVDPFDLVKVQTNIQGATPVGRSGNPFSSVSPNTPTTIDGVKFTGHALDQMQARGILSPRAVIDVINNPASSFPGNRIGTTIFIRDNLKVVTNNFGDVMTVILQ
ncbi:DUF4258 domain-containing protein, partial [Arenibacter sp. GZD96]|uniref:DUF4258 domain-containing protein n=1 Tax=Aurantibrevibacter litoralis TaxID=3106030 RepID=UPI002AFFF61B